MPAEAGEPLPVVREAVRAILLSSPAYLELPPEKRRRLARAMVRVCQTAASLIGEEMESHDEARRAARPVSSPLAAPPRRTGARALQNAGEAFSGVSASRVAGTTQAILNAVSFPRFVTELINGVFKAMVESSQQQMNAYVELLQNVAASTDGFADSNMGPDRARQWLADRYPASFVFEAEPEEDRDPEEPSSATLRLRPGASMPSEGALRTDLGLEEGDSIPGSPEALVPLARRRLSQTRQQTLATMVMLGMQRIVVESGRINAAMRFHIDTRSVARADQGSRFDFQNVTTASGSFGAGPWGVSASMTNTIGYVSTQQTQTAEEMNTSLDLNSSVEINFKTDYLPLNRMATPATAARIEANTLNPDAERERRLAAAEEGDRARSASIGSALAPRTAAPTPTSGPGSIADAEAARARARGGTGGGAATGTGGGAAAPPSGGGAAAPSEAAPAQGGTVSPAPAQPQR